MEAEAMSTIDNVVRPRASESSELKVLRDAIEQSAEHYTPCLIGPDGTQIEIPPSAFRVLQAVVHGMAAGKTITIVPSGQQLTTQQAAEMLQVSRPHLVKLLDAGEIPFSRTGTHRRLDAGDVLRYRDERAALRRDQLRELTRASERIAGSYE
jgi:excisionase family DNA binding protein